MPLICSGHSEDQGLELDTACAEKLPMQPATLGAADEELTEMQALTCSSSAFPRADPCLVGEILNTVFDRLAEEASAERGRAVRLGHPTSAAKRNRQATYLDKATRHEWCDRARAFIERRGDVAAGRSRSSLYALATMQHLQDLDAQDPELPQSQRRSEDSYADGVNGQFMLDAARGHYVVDGEVFDFAEATGGETEEDFISRLLARVRSGTPAPLLPRVTAALSQSGQAALERACLCRVVVAGGEQRVEYTHEVRQADDASPPIVVVHLRSSRFGFAEYLLDGDDDAEPAPCDRKRSFVRKSATVEFGSTGDVDVVEVEERCELWSKEGRQLPAEGLFHAVPLPGPSNSNLAESMPLLGARLGGCRARVAAALRLLAACLQGCGRRFCTRRLWNREVRTWSGHGADAV